MDTYGTTTAGVKVKVRGRDLWDFGMGKLRERIHIWKIVEPATK
jgi:hypothetical protein